MRKVYLVVLFFFCFNTVFAQITQWTFETSLPASAGPHTAEVGTGSALRFAAGTPAYGVVVGNGSPRSFSSNTWAINDYYQFQFPTTGYQNISITWDATGSGTGPRDFKVQYSTNGTVFTDAVGINSSYQLTGETWSSTLYNPASTRTLDLNFVTALNNAATVYIRLVVTSTVSIGAGVIATGGTSRVDNFTVNGTLIPANTITLTTLSSTTFNLPDCFTTASGTVDFTSTNTFNPGNIFTAQLSDASGSFATYTIIGSLSFFGVAPSGTINFTIPNGTASSTTYKIRIVSSSPLAYSNLSPDITINQLGTCVSSATDFFRSKSNGSWNSNSTWESSATGIAGTWIPATLTPTSSANTITIRNGHTVTVTVAVTIDQLIIQNGGIVVHSVGVLTINDDATGDDVIVQSGGIFSLSFLNNPPIFSPLTATANINTGGTLRVTVGGMTAVGAGVNSSNYIYQNASVLELTTGFTTNGVTYFPNVDAVTIPIFRSTGVLSVGAAGNTTINGVFEANNSITFINTGNKIFRNGIRGTGNITGSASGPFIINGTTAELGGTGSLIVPTTGGLEIGSASGTTVTVTSNKTVTGDISLISTNTYVELGSNNLTVSGTINNPGINAYIRTNGTGALVHTSVTNKTFPIGNTSYNPITISNGQSNNFNARVATGINDPAVAFPTYGINRTWYIGASSVTPSVTVAFQYAGTDAGINVSPTETMELLMSDYIAWSILVGNNSITPTGSDPYTVTSTTGLSINNTPNPFAIGKAGGYILPLDCIITARSRKINNNGLISWDINSCAEVNSFEVQRSVNGSGFQTIRTVTPGVSLEYNHIDASLEKGTNLYRIKVNRSSGSIKYSNTVAIINDSKGILITALSPNPVNNNATLVINGAKAATVIFVISDITGRPVKQWSAPIAEGSNSIPINASGLAAGIYHLGAMTGDAKTVIRFVKQ